MNIAADPTEFAGKRVLISGGTKGLGRATVDRFLAGGARVITAARGAMEPVDGVEFVQADLTTSEGGKALAEAALERMGGRNPGPRHRRFVHARRWLCRTDGRALALRTEPEPSGHGPP
jgi:NAD(P)-dependent dehydrogenase (short-subunit alcohol dehydrogenase family)